MEFSSAVKRNEEGFYRLSQECPQDHCHRNKVELLSQGYLIVPMSRKLEQTREAGAGWSGPRGTNSTSRGESKLLPVAGKEKLL